MGNYSGHALGAGRGTTVKEFTKKAIEVGAFTIWALVIVIVVIGMVVAANKENDRTNAEIARSNLIIEQNRESVAKLAALGAEAKALNKVRAANDDTNGISAKLKWVPGTVTQTCAGCTNSNIVATGGASPSGDGNSWNHTHLDRCDYCDYRLVSKASVQEWTTSRDDSDLWVMVGPCRYADANCAFRNRTSFWFTLPDNLTEAMTDKERWDTGVESLTKEQKAALQTWMDRYANEVMDTLILEARKAQKERK